MKPIGSTNLYCLLGSPAKHSISPLMHNTAFEELNLDNCYMAFDVKPEDFKSAVDGLKTIGCKGFNLTMPFKKDIIPYLDEIDDGATLANSVNTVVVEDGRLKGYTTDGIGFLQAMTDSGIDYHDSTITVLGAGGAATSIIVAAALDGVSQINVFKRNNATFQDTVDFADQITHATDCDVFVYDFADMDALSFSLKESSILINATNVGMGDDDTSLIPKDMLYKELTVCDVIYHPPETRLLKDAKEVGCKIMNGKYMLLYQGAAAFKLWTGEDMPIDLIKRTCFDNN
jgi:shikimate dehydrogenase